MRRLALVLTAASSFACSSPDQTLGAFRLAWTESPPTLAVTAADGRVLLRSAATLVDVRQAEAAWETQFGSFKLTESEAPWHVATRLRATRRDADALTFEVDLADGSAVTLAVTSPGEGRLALAWSGAAGNRIRTHFQCSATDHFLGFGAQADEVDHRGHRIPIWVSEPGIGKTDLDEIDAERDPLWFYRGTRHASSYPLPTFLSSRGFAFLADTTRRTVFDLCRADEVAWSVETWSGAVTQQLFDGPAPALALQRLTAEIGRQPLANDLAFAPWNDAIFGAAEVRRIADLLRSERIPSGALWTEDFRGGEDTGDSYRLEEEWDVDRALYPDLEGLSQELHSKGFRFLAYHNTFLTSGTRILEQARAEDVLVKRPGGGEYLFVGVKFTDTALVDLTHPRARPFVVGALERLISAGFDGWMADYGEWLPPDAALHSGADAEAAHNEYPRDYHSVVADALTRHASPNLATSFSRSGTLRTAPLQPVVWAGDQWTSFAPDDGLPTVVTMGLNFGLAGISTYGHDIAGYQNGRGPPSTRELFFRWTTLGALSPVMRTHHGTKARDNWWFGKDADTLAHFRRWSRFHARLWPYLSAAARIARDTGLPIMRQLAIAFPDSDFAWTTKDAYLFGPSIFVAPVVTEGAVSRDVRLPPGAWFAHEGGPALAGDRTLSVAAPVTEIPLFSRPGTIIPLLPDTLDTLMPADPPLIDLDDVRSERALLVFAGEGTTTDLDGTTYTSTGSVESPSNILISGVPALACGSAAPPCFEHDPASRRLTLRGPDLRDVRIDAAAVTTTGALRVTEISFRY
jgi:alpha-glucosidase (family GH31 glycosyl hydrolase)